MLNVNQGKYSSTNKNKEAIHILAVCYVTKETKEVQQIENSEQHERSLKFLRQWKLHKSIPLGASGVGETVVVCELRGSFATIYEQSKKQTELRLIGQSCENNVQNVLKMNVF